MPIKISPLLLAISFVCVIAVLGAMPALDADGFNSWYLNLHKPVDPPMWLFGFAQLAYYVICIFLLYRLFTASNPSPLNKKLRVLLVATMIYAEAWNYIFFGSENVLIGLWTILPFVLMSVLVFYSLRKVDRLGARAFGIYLAWLLLIDMPWMLGLVIANPVPSPLA